MPRLVKRMPRFIRKSGRDRYSSLEGAPSSLWAHLVGRSTSGVAVDPQSALSMMAYYSGVRVISEDTASLPIAVFKRQKSGGAVLATDHAVSALMGGSPDGAANEMSSMQWREAWTAHAIGWGNGYAEIERTQGDGTPLGLHIAHPGSTEVKRDIQKRLFYRLNGTGDPVPSSDVLHLAGLGFNGLVGYSPVALAREAIGLGRAAEQFGASLFTNGAVPKGFLKYPGKLKPEARSNLRDSWNAMHQGVGNANKVGILEEGMEWVATSINPDDAQFLATRQFQVLEIARMLRLPPHKLQDYSQSHLANIEASNLDYLTTTLRPWCERIEQCLQLKLLSDSERRRGYYIRHDIRELLRGAIKDRAFYYKAMFDFGMSPNEIFELEDLNPIPDEDGGNMRFRTLQSVPLASIPAGLTPAAGVPEVPTDPTAPVDGSGTNGPATYSGRRNGRFFHENGVI